MYAISLIYGEEVLDDLKFCRQYNKSIMRYAHGIMTLQGSPGKTLEAIAMDPTSVPGWTHLLESHPQDCAVLQEFLKRLIRHYVKTRRLRRTGS